MMAEFAGAVLSWVINVCMLAVGGGVFMVAWGVKFASLGSWY
jgi:hypothetical protein